MSPSAAQRRTILSHPAGWIASGFGAGLSPLAPGTVGSAVALLPYPWLRELPLWGYLAFVAAVFVLGIWASRVLAARLHIEDPGCIVVDEFVGQWLALAFAPPGWIWILVGFLLFRLFDVAKPWPVSWADRRVGGGLGVMLDDALAGLLAAAALAVLVWGVAHF
ncbi:MAG: phosphatidylglycerophosphatase A [Lysobacterales bacterium 69-70]|nr:phosphatidylglycerophosphatase A [Xanthomonadaceae bacterium]ODU36438.1 MAG: phosphatidylglycerophosphatase A [Xanthomonadaceae bacterium SCN 69-320]ODV21784.1 MAG: phosphatidylglycerophosphatase A [Xanthomonadaceae bacterium SCN 69-25]OJY95984.1 MAG: phosphatidylglycerophosphatase A [Xanthomonadales bacterium 69-70]